MNLHKYAHTSDTELLNQFYDDGNNEWLGIVLQRYTMLLFGVCMKYLKNEEEARDAVQQVFLKAINELQKYRVDYIKSWLYMVAKNHCLMKLRDKGKTTLELNDRVLSTPNDEPGIKALLEKDRSLDKLSTAIKELNKEQQVCVTLFYLEQKSYRQVSEITGYSLLQVKSFIQNGKRNLKLIIEKTREDE